MPHVFESAPTGRSKCRGCGQAIPKDEMRFGERLPNPFAEGEMTHWFHPTCAAYKRPEPILAALAESPPGVADRAALEAIARRALEHPRVQRIDGAERAPGAQARCRHCKEPIERGAWRIRLVLHEDGQVSPGGFIHLSCREAYFEAGDILEQVLHFSRSLGADDRAALKAEFSPKEEA